mmetsp:Transcript_119629/g.298349  ORF Transcript_119629/g.298349 Transcript_119629/m.298349 type:complete len:251 (-) Transcript_119629:342-1094(-)
MHPRRRGSWHCSPRAPVHLALAPPPPRRRPPPPSPRPGSHASHAPPPLAAPSAWSGVSFWSSSSLLDARHGAQRRGAWCRGAQRHAPAAQRCRVRRPSEATARRGEPRQRRRSARFQRRRRRSARGLAADRGLDHGCGGPAYQGAVHGAAPTACLAMATSAAPPAASPLSGFSGSAASAGHLSPSSTVGARCPWPCVSWEARQPPGTLWRPGFFLRGSPECEAPPRSSWSNRLTPWPPRRCLFSNASLAP